MNTEDIFSYWDKEGTSHIRKEREGDKYDKQEKEKIYPPLLEMKSLTSFIKKIKDL